MIAASGTVSGEEPVTLGHVLSWARESRGLTLEGVASTLRVEPHLVAALEEDRFEFFVAPVFVKGHLRQLAGLYGLGYEELLALYVREANVADVQLEVVPPVGKRRRVRWRLVFVGLILLAGVAASLFAGLGGNSLIPFRDWSWEALLPVVEPAGSDAAERGAGAEAAESSNSGSPATGMDPVEVHPVLGETDSAQVPTFDESGTAAMAHWPGAAVMEPDQ